MAIAYAFCPFSLSHGLRGIPTRIDVTPNGGGEHDERAVLERTIEGDRLYVADRGYAKFTLFNKIAAASSSQSRVRFLLGLLIAGGIAGAHLVGLLRRSRAGWLWNRNTTRTLGTWALLPLLFGLACMVFALTGGNVPVGMRMPVAILFYAGLLSLIPAILLWAIYVSLNRPTAKRYYRVCPDCAVSCSDIRNSGCRENR